MPAKFTEFVDVYSDAQITDATQNVLPGAFSLVAANRPINIHRGGKDAKDDASGLGVEIDRGALGYMQFEDDALIRPGFVLVQNSRTEYWRVSGMTDARGRFAATKHLRVPLELMTARPDGVPTIDTCQAVTSSIASCTDIYTP